MLRARFAYCVVALALLGVGCKDDAKGPTGPTLEELGPEMTEAVCKEFEACVGAKYIDVALGGFDCGKNLLAQLEDDGFAQLETAIEAKRVTYSAGAVDTCLESIGKLGCGITTQRLSAIEGCGDVFEGSIDVGDDCDVDEACTGDAYCKRDNACPGTCTARGAKGDDCDADDSCKNGLTCGDDGKCAAPAEEDDACGTATTAACDFGLICVGADEATSKAGKCKKLASAFAGGEGDECDLQATKLCDVGLSCVVKVSGTTATYTCAKQVGSGDDCAFGAPSQCPKDEYCDADVTMAQFEGKCQPLPKAGEDCLTPIPGAAQCAPGLSCGGDGTCRELGRIGDACTEDVDCASNHCEGKKCATDFCEL